MIRMHWEFFRLCNQSNKVCFDIEDYKNLLVYTFEDKRRCKQSGYTEDSFCNTIEVILVICFDYWLLCLKI